MTSVGGYPGTDEKGAEAFRKVDGKKMTEDFVAAARWLKARPDSTRKLGDHSWIGSVQGFFKKHLE